MAKKHQVGVQIKTSSDTAGAQKTERALDEVKESARQLREMLENTEGIDPKVAKRLQGLGDKLERVDKTGRKVTTMQGAMTKSTRRTDLAMLSFSQAVEDAQYGIRGVLNNIPSLIMQLGGGAGLAGVISLSAVGLTMLGSALTGTEKKAEETGEEVDALRDYFQDLHEEVEKGKFELYADKLRVVDRVIRFQNESLKANIALTSQKRKQELALAAAQDDLKRAQIAQRVLRDDGYSEEEGTRDVAALDIARQQRENEAAKAAEQERIFEAERAMAEIDEQIVARRASRNEKEQKLDEMAEEAILLEQKIRMQRQLQLKLDAERKKRGSFDYMAENTAQFIMTRGELGFGEKEDPLALAKIDSAATPEEKGRYDALKSQMAEIRSSLKEDNQAIAELGDASVEAMQTVTTVTRSAKAATEHLSALGEVKEDVLETVESTRQASEARATLAGSASEMQSLSEKVAGDNILESKALANTAQNLRRITDDGVVTMGEMQHLEHAIDAASKSIVDAGSRQAARVSSLERAVIALKAELNATKQTQIQVQSIGKQ